ncbi:MAG: histidine kinase N-terminal 7TM domain-containing protein [Patescibacteria group bacterium]|nr:histidine kinase N-terminal 7TM domain-containing protein [Patescibacteria group bacterium]
MILKYLLSVILYINVILMVVSFCLSYILLKRKGSGVHYFGMALLVLGLWMLFTLSDYFRLTPLSPIFHAQMGFLTGALVLIFFYLFTRNFPVPDAAPKSKYYFFYGIVIFIAFISFWPEFITSAYSNFPFRYRTINPFYLTIYNTYFFLFSALSFKNLFVSYEGSGGIYKIQLRKIIVGSAFVVLSNIIFSLLNFYYTNFDLTAIGIFFTFIILFYIYSILFKD